MLAIRILARRARRRGSGIGWSRLILGPCLLAFLAATCGAEPGQRVIVKFQEGLTVSAKGEHFEVAIGDREKTALTADAVAAAARALHARLDREPVVRIDPLFQHLIEGDPGGSAPDDPDLRLFFAITIRSGEAGKETLVRDLAGNPLVFDVHVESIPVDASEPVPPGPV
jgi:hypothetical protein